MHQAPLADRKGGTEKSAQGHVAAWVGAGLGGRVDTGIGMAEFLCCPSETITASLISYTPVQNKKSNTHTHRSCVNPLS